LVHYAGGGVKRKTWKESGASNRLLFAKMEPHMKTVLLTVVIAALASSASAATIRPSQALSAQGQLVIVEGTANIHDDTARAGKDVDVTAGDSHLVAFIPLQSKDVFPALDSFNGKTVGVTGVVLFNSGRPEIRLMRANQLKLATP